MARLWFHQMRSRRARSRARNRGRDERGAVLVEFVMVLPLLMALLIGSVTAGLAYNRNNSMNNGAREAARFGATLPAGGDLTTWLNSVADVARDSTTGDMDPSVPAQQLCVAYVHPDGTDVNDQTHALNEVAGVRTVTPGSTCFVDGRPDDERRVQITMERTSELEAVIYSATLNLTSRSVARFERFD